MESREWVLELINFLADDALGLAFAPGQGADGEDITLGKEAEAFAEVFGHRVTGHARFGLDVDRHVRSGGSGAWPDWRRTSSCRNGAR